MISFKYKSIITLIFICIILSCLSLLNKGYAFTDKDNIQKVNNWMINILVFLFI